MCPTCYTVLCTRRSHHHSVCYTIFKMHSIKHRKQHRQYESTNRKISERKRTIKLIMLLTAHSNSDILKGQLGAFVRTKTKAKLAWNTQHNVRGSERDIGRSAQRTKEGSVRFGSVRFGSCSAFGWTGLMLQDQR